MKNTLLIAALALGSVAAAADLVKLSNDINLVSSYTKPNGDVELTSGRTQIKFDTNGAAAGGTSLNNYVLTFQFLKSDSINQDAFLRIAGKLYVRGTTDQEGITSPIYVMKGADATGTTMVSDGYISANTNDTYALTVSAENNVAYLSNLSTHEYVTVSDLQAVYGTKTLTLNSESGTEVFWTNNANVKVKFGQVADLTGFTNDDLKNVAAYGVPEPATATLSLLALAGLASRRRH